MADWNFNSVFVAFAVCMCTQLDVILLQNPPGSNWAGYYKETENVDFGIRMWYEQSKGTTMKVTISYDTETQSASDFFKTQISAKLIDDFNSCNVISWVFNPCTTSKFYHGSLVCLKGTTQCYFDQVHSCVASALKDNQSGMGKFLICRFALGKTTNECGKASGVNDDTIKNCVNSGDGAKECNDFHTIFQDARTKRTQSEAEKAATYPNAITDFKNTVCQVLAQGSLKCDAVCAQP